MKQFIKQNSGYIAWALALASMLGSLYFSEVLKLPPCVLCWYQRIAMYPMVLIIGIGLIKKARDIADYTLPLSLIGLAIAIYHNLLYYHIIPESISPCMQGFSCTTKQIELLGFITIPFMAMIGFALITIFLLIHRSYMRNSVSVQQ